MLKVIMTCTIDHMRKKGSWIIHGDTKEIFAHMPIKILFI